MVDRPRIAVGDRVEVTRPPLRVLGHTIENGDRGVVLSVSPDEVFRTFGLDATEAYVQLDRIPDQPAVISFAYLRVLDVVDKIGELDGNSTVS